MQEDPVIADLIELKALRPVIQLGNSEDELEALHSFVWTENLKETLSDFKERCLKQQGGGIFLKGHYGTGKSHLLSYLSQKAEMGFSTTEEALYKATPISLIRHSANESLESITQQQLKLTKEPTSDRNVIFDHYLEALKEKGYQGYLILYDELSEFLKSKESPASLAEDIRFLQFLAEYGAHHQSWIIGAIQEDIEGIGHASRETSLKLKDRFALRWNLSTLHVEDILSERLLQKKQGATDLLEDLFQEFHQLWPDSFPSIESFQKIYPLHPGALDLLMGLGTLFSEHRGVLRFVLDILNGNPTQHVKAHLKTSAKQLICADQIFDYFSERLQENLELKNYYQKVWVHLESRCLQLIDQEDQELTLRVLKVIILANLDPRREGISIEELNALCMFRLGDQAEMAQEYLRDVLLNKLIGRVNYLNLEDNLYKIKLQHLEFELLNKLLDQSMAELDLKQFKSWDALIQLMDRPPLDFASFWKDPKSMGPITWLNTQRRLTLTWSHEQSEADIRIALPQQALEFNEQSQLTLVPRELNEKEKDTCLRAAALLLMKTQSSSTQVEQQAKTEADKRIKHESHEWRSLLEQLYREGQWYLGSKKIQLSSMWEYHGGFEANLEFPVYDLLSDRHPFFRAIAPKVEYYNERSLSDLIDGFVKAKQVSEAQLKQAKLFDLVVGIARPLGLAVKDKQSYRFEFEANHHPFLQEFESQLKQQQYDLLKTREALEEGPYGLPPKLFDFIIWAIVEADLFEAYRDKEPLPASKISFYNIRSLTHIQAIKSLDRDSLTQLTQTRFFSDIDASLSPQGLQQQLWTHFETQLKSTQSKAEFCQPMLQHSPWSFSQDVFTHLFETIHELKLIYDSHSRSAMEGLQALLQKLDTLESFHHSLPYIKEAHSFFKSHQNDFPELLNYLQDDFHDNWSQNGSAPSLAEDRTALLLETHTWNLPDLAWTRIETWMEHTLAWKKKYREFYTHCHKRDCQSQIKDSKQIFIETLNQAGYPSPNHKVQVCDRDQNLELQHKPFCRCAYIPKPEELHENDDERLQQFLRDFDLQPQLKEELLECIESNLFDKAIALWNEQKEKLSPSIQKVSFRSFQKSLQGKTHNRESLKQAFEIWLKELPDSNFEIDDP